MVNVLSTIELKDSMVEELKSLRSDISYRFKRGKDLTIEDRTWADVLNTYGSHIKAYPIEDFENLKWLNVMSAGVDSLPFEKLVGVQVTNARGIHKIQMTEFTIGLILNYYKNFFQTHQDQKNMFWDSKSYTEEVYGKTAHIFGTGSIGSHIAKVLGVLGVNTVGYNTNGREVENFNKTYSIDKMHDTIHGADIVVSILPATDKTNELFDIEFFNAMKDEAIFINIGRGNVVSDDVLLEVLKKNLIGHLILDVFNKEPLEADSPFYKYDNITITPHSSAKTDMYLERAFDIFKYNMSHYDDYEAMKNIIDSKRGY